MPVSESEWEEFASLDLGCGIGRHVNFLDDFGLNPYGIDLSDEAIRLGKEWFDLIDKPKLKERLIVGSVTEIPFESNFFNICVSCGVLDSMPREVAEQGMNEVKRVLKSGGLFYLDMIIDEKIGNQDIIQSDGYEMNTVQSYSTIERVKEFAEIVGPIIDFNLISYCRRTGGGSTSEPMLSYDVSERRISRE